MGRQIKTFRGLPYQVDSGFELVVTGRWSKGGAGEVLHDNEVIDPDLKLPKAQFFILAQLMQKAKQAGGKRGAAGMHADELAMEMQRIIGLGGNDPHSVHTAVDKLRKRLTSKLVTAYVKAAGVTWNSDIIELHPNLGYRVSLPPENQHLELLDLP
jgi:hypothetical protein